MGITNKHLPALFDEPIMKQKLACIVMLPLGTLVAGGLIGYPLLMSIAYLYLFWQLKDKWM
ncbi:MAG: hypothetical protein D6732_17380 [Methanobacteriota archaeon]|nr:MAG: hypothetical protein D6732_17380 [Euryarchaeota archaeon]